MALGSRRWVLALVTAAATVIACNAIIGVEDVKLKGIGGTRLTNEGGEDDANVGDDDDNTPIKTDGDAPAEPERPSLALGFSHTCARMTNSTVRCWGSNFFGQMGDGVEILDANAPIPPDILRPQDVPGIKDAVAIASGTNHTCVVRATGKVSCWGDNYAGQLGNNTEIDSSKPVDVVGIDDAIAVGAGGTSTCIIHKTKKASCWGNNSRGGLGDGTNADSKIPVNVSDLDDIAQIAPAANHTCAVRTNGELWCWGGGADGQLGTGLLADTTKPTQVKTISTVAQVATASLYSCARLTTGQVQCWGRNADGQLGSGEPNPAANPSPISLAINDVSFLWAGSQHTCAVRKTTGKVSCWGNGQLGQLGIGPTDAATNKRPLPTDVEVLTTARQVWTGGARSCAITSDNKALCWGRNSDGQLGNGSADDKNVPTPVSDF